MAHPTSVSLPQFVILTAVLAACSDPVGMDTPYVVVPVSTATLAGTAGWTLTDTLVVEVRDGEGHLVPGAKVTWSLPQGGRLAVQLADVDDPMTGTADDRGRNFAVWTLGLGEGTQVARAVSGVTGAPAEFEAEARTLHATAVSAGWGYACAILADRRPVCWGANHYGSLGTGDTEARVNPTPVVGLTAVQELQASAFGRTCARDMAGDTWCWGAAFDGAGGVGATVPGQLVPLRIQGAEGASAIASPLYYGFTCALFTAGGAKCWGVNWGGQLGTGDLVSSELPRPVVGSADFVSIASGENRVCALDSQGEAWCWGRAGLGEFSPLPSGNYSTPTRPVPETRYSSIAVGYWAVCGIEQDGSSSCFGNWGNFSLGTTYPPAEYETSAPVRPDIRINLRSIVYNGDDAVFALSRFGELYSWGEFNPFPLPTFQVIQEPRFTEVSAGGPQFCGITETGAVYCGRMDYSRNGNKPTLTGVPVMTSP